MSWPSFNPVGGYVTVVLVAAVLAALAWLGPARGRLAPRRRRTLVAIRLLVILVVLLAMLRPAIVHSVVSRQSATLVLLADRSRSMQVADAAGQKTRWAALVAALDDVQDALARLGKEIEVKLYTFDSHAQAVDSQGGRFPLDERPEGQQTAIGAVLEDVLRREAGKRLAGVILLSDGAQRAIAPRDVPPQTPARRLADLGYRLYAVPLGQARGLGQARDVAVEDLVVPPEVFVKNRLGVSSAVRVDGFVNQNLAVQLLFETAPGTLEPVGAVQVAAREDGQRLPIELEYVPEVAGEYKLTVRAAAPQGELVTTNNEMSTFVSVLKGGLNVLYLEGQPRVEQKFIRRGLDASPDIKLDYLRIDPQQPQTRPADLAERFRPGAYDVYLLGDLDSTALSAEAMTLLAAAVERGAGLMMLGGFHSFGAGGYGATPLAAVLPIEIDRLERQNFGEPIRQDLHLVGRPKVVPTQIGLTQSLMLLAARNENAAAWAQLPPLEGANRFRGLKPGAQVLAETPDREPLLVAKDHGAGRVLAFAGDSTWHWWLGGFETLHKRFWRQTVLWLARKDQLTDSQVSIALAQRRFAPGARVEFGLAARTPDGEPIPDAAFSVEVVGPTGTKGQARLRRQGEQTLALFLDAQAAGDYTIRASAAHGGQPLGSAQARFLVYQQDLELDNPAADRGTLESIAAMTGGRTVAPEQLPELIEELRALTKSLEVHTQIKTTLWDTWPVLIAFVALAACEWYLHKKWGLV